MYTTYVNEQSTFRSAGTRLRLSHEIHFLWSLYNDPLTTHSPRTPQRNEATEHLVQAAGRRHGSLDDNTANVLPALLEQGDKVVDGQHEVGNKLLLGHLDVADGDTKAQNLLELELDGGLDVVDLVLHVFGVGDGGGELAGCGRD
jgi:hypothetical protein